MATKTIPPRDCDSVDTTGKVSYLVRCSKYEGRSKVRPFPLPVVEFVLSLPWCRFLRISDSIGGLGFYSEGKTTRFGGFFLLPADHLAGINKMLRFDPN